MDGASVFAVIPISIFFAVMIVIGLVAISSDE
jgi:hypothetical protein